MLSTIIKSPAKKLQGQELNPFIIQVKLDVKPEIKRNISPKRRKNKSHTMMEPELSGAREGSSSIEMNSRRLSPNDDVRNLLVINI